MNDLIVRPSGLVPTEKDPYPYSQVRRVRFTQEIMNRLGLKMPIDDLKYIIAEGVKTINTAYDETKGEYTMNELVNITITEEGVATVSSRQVAEDFGKQHKDVLKAICGLQTSAQNCANLFFESTYPDKYGRKQKEYLMTRDGFSLLVMGFTGKEALSWKLKYIEAFNKMETVLNSPEQLMARALKYANEKIRELEEQVTVLIAPRNRAEEPQNLTGIRETAKELGLGVHTFVGCLVGLHYLYRAENGRLLPNPEHVESGLFYIKDMQEKGWGYVKTMLTDKGKETFRQMFTGSASA